MTNNFMLIMGWLLPLVFGVITLIVIYSELRARRLIQKESLDFERKRYEHALVRESDRDKWLDEQYLRLASAAEPLAEQITSRLKVDTRWAADALERARLGAHTQSVFGERRRHFSEEKECLAQYFVPLLLARCRSLVESGKTVFLMMDSGTTLYPFFEKIAGQFVRLREMKEVWVDNVLIASNNLPGIQTLMESGRMNPNNRFSSLAVNCHLFPGDPLTVYSAVTGTETNEAVVRLRNSTQTKGEAVFLALVVGNWICLDPHQAVYPVPMARARGHLEFKQTLVDNSDEIYVVTPLGKVFYNRSVEEINSAMGFRSDHPDPAFQSYKAVKIDKNKMPLVKMISTTRKEGRVLFALSERVRAQLSAPPDRYEAFSSLNVAEVPHVLIPFDKLPDHRVFEIETEFPHAYTRDSAFMKEYFFVDPRHLNGAIETTAIFAGGQLERTRRRQSR